MRMDMYAFAEFTTMESKGETSMKPSKTDILICNKRELNSKVSYWENQKRKAEKQLQKLKAEIKELEKEIAKELSA